MAYAVEFTRRAERDLNDLYEFLSAEHSVVARRWFNGLEKAIYTLAKSPRRCPRAPESRKAGRPLRHLLYGTMPNIYRVLYEIDEPYELVRVLTIRHGARDALIARELGKREPKAYSQQFSRSRGASFFPNRPNQIGMPAS